MFSGVFAGAGRGVWIVSYLSGVVLTMSELAKRGGGGGFLIINKPDREGGGYGL